MENTESNEILNEYNEIVKDFIAIKDLKSFNYDWTNPNDFIVKFSLYKELPNSVTSTDTVVTI